MFLNSEDFEEVIKSWIKSQGETKSKVERAAKELRRRRIETEMIRLGGELIDDEVKFLRKGGDVELQMMLLLALLLKMVGIVFDDFKSQNLGSEEANVRLYGIQLAALNLMDEEKSRG